MVTATGHVISLIPGSLVVEVDRSTSTLYIHGINVRNAEDAARAAQGGPGHRSRTDPDHGHQGRTLRTQQEVAA